MGEPARAAEKIRTAPAADLRQTACGVRIESRIDSEGYYDGAADMIGALFAEEGKPTRLRLEFSMYKEP